MELLIKLIDKDSKLKFYPFLGILTVFDHSKYERSEMDMLSPAQRKYIEDGLSSLDFKWSSGRVLESKKNGIKLFFPKPRILASSPFDILNGEKKEKNKIFVLTPTQTACFLLRNLESNKALELVLELIEDFPININKIKDHVSQEDCKVFFLKEYEQLFLKQKELEESGAYDNKSHIGRFF